MINDNDDENGKEINENSIISFATIKKNEMKRIDIPIQTSKIIIKLIICFCIILLLMLIYLINLNIYVRENFYDLKSIINEIKIKEHYSNNNDDNILEQYKKVQNEFCENSDKYKNLQYENDIILTKIKFNSINTYMYMPKSFNWVLHAIKNNGAYEEKMTSFIEEALKFYGFKNNILNNKDIIMLDIGGNVGWYPSILGRYNYTIITFEAFKKNIYIQMKNFCYLNKNSNVYIVTKGLGSEKKICNYFSQNNNSGNGMVVCQKKDILKDKLLKKQFTKISEVEIITLNSLIPFLSDKYIALIKMDVEGNEFKVIEGGKELITKYHVPFVVLEFSPIYLKELGTDPLKLVQFFVENDYKISIDGFLSKNYITVDELFAKTKFQIDCYFIHTSMIQT